MRLNDQGLSLPIYYRNGQWAVTQYGVERCDGRRYEIPAERLSEIDYEGHSMWIMHMTAKGNVAAEDFVVAFTVALAIHKITYRFDLTGAIREALIRKGTAARFNTDGYLPEGFSVAELTGAAEGSRKDERLRETDPGPGAGEIPEN